MRPTVALRYDVHMGNNPDGIAIGVIAINGAATIIIVVFGTKAVGFCQPEGRHQHFMAGLAKRFIPCRLFRYAADPAKIGHVFNVFLAMAFNPLIQLRVQFFLLLLC